MTEFSVRAEQQESPSAAEVKRLDALSRSGLLDVPPDEAFDRLTRLASTMLRAPVALISLVAQDRQFFLSQYGLSEPWASLRETPLSHSFCQHVASTGAPLVIADARETPLVRDNLAVRDLAVIAYLGVPLLDHDGNVLGSLCVIDDRRRHWTAEEAEALSSLALTVMNEIMLRHELRERLKVEAALRESEARNLLLLRELSHRIRNFAAVVQAITRQTLQFSTDLPAATEALAHRLAALARIHDLPGNRADGSIEIGALVEQETGPFLRDEGSLRVSGERTWLSREAGQMFALVLHELATNATKHGALSSEAGTVDVTWTVSRDRNAQETLCFQWIERGGPPISASRRRGFGTQLLDRAATALGGESERTLDPRGFEYRISVPLSAGLRNEAGQGLQARAGG